MRIEQGTAAGAAPGGPARLWAAAAPVGIWGGLECSVARIGDDYRDLLAETGHCDCSQNLDAFAQAGFRSLRYPVLWE